MGRNPPDIAIARSSRALALATCEKRTERRNARWPMPLGHNRHPRAPAAAKAAVRTLQDLSGRELNQRMVERRAIEAIIWGMPAVNFELMYQAMVRETKGGFNQIVYWSRLPDWKNQTLTPKSGHRST